MTMKTSSSQVLNQDAVFSAQEKSLAMIEFEPYGGVLWANENFANTMGYQVNELPNMHHRQFCTKEFTNSPDYDQFWRELRSKKHSKKKYKESLKMDKLKPLLKSLQI